MFCKLVEKNSFRISNISFEEFSGNSSPFIPIPSSIRHSRVFTVISDFVIFNLSCTNETDSRFTRRRLPRGASNKRQDEQWKLEKDHTRMLQILSMKLSSVDQYIFKRCTRQNVAKAVKS